MSRNSRDMRSTMSVAQPKRFLPTRQVGARYGVTSRTVFRWRQQKTIPAPDVTINNRHYWDEATLDHHDRQLVVANADRKITLDPSAVAGTKDRRRDRDTIIAPGDQR